jgi:hypothetical protein
VPENAEKDGMLVGLPWVSLQEKREKRKRDEIKVEHD